jgi:hypothetical protein
MMAMFAALAACAQPTNAPPAPMTVTEQRPKLHLLGPGTTAKENGAISKPVQGLGPRPWSTVVGWRQGISGFAEPETHQGGLTLFWVDREPTTVSR